MPTIEECWEDVLEAAKRWRDTVYVDRLGTEAMVPLGVWPEERALAEAVDRLRDKE